MGLAHEGPGRPMRARPLRAPGGHEGQAHKGPGGPTRARSIRARAQPTRAVGRGPIRARPVRTQRAWLGHYNEIKAFKLGGESETSNKRENVTYIYIYIYVYIVSEFVSQRSASL